MKILQVKITTEDKPITLPDIGIADNVEYYRKQIRAKYKDLITKHTSEYFNPRVLLIYSDE